MFILEIGLKTNSVVLESMFLYLEKSMRENGRMVLEMAKEKINGFQEKNMKDNGFKIKEREWEKIHGQMEMYIMESGKII